MTDTAWDRLRAQLDFAGEPWFGFVFSPSRAATEELTSQADDFLRWRTRRLATITVLDAGELVPAAVRVARMVAAAELAWVDATAVVPGADPTAWDHAWRNLARVLNGQRDALLRTMAGGLVVCGPAAAKPLIREAAPDLWSMRSLVVEIAPVRSDVPEGRLPRDRWTAAVGARTRTRTAAVSLAPGEAKGLLDEAAEALLRDQPAAALASAARAVDQLVTEGAPSDDLIAALVVLSRAEAATGESPIGTVRRALSLGPTDHAVRAELLDGLGAALLRIGDLVGARAAYEESLAQERAFADRLGDSVGEQRVAISLDNLGDVALAEGDLAGARAAFTESLEIDRRLADRSGTPHSERDLSVSLSRLGDVLRAEGDLAGARAAFAESLDLARRLAERLGTPESDRDLSVSLNKLGDVLRAEGDLAGARAAYAESLDLARRLAERPGTPQAREDRAFVEARLAALEGPVSAGPGT